MSADALVRGVLVATLLWTGAACSAQGRELLDCRFIPVQFEEDTVPNCAYLDAEGHLVLEPEAIAAVRARGHDPVAASVGSTLYYVNGAGRAVPVLRFDNGADYFQEGLARTVRDGKIGFIDRSLTVRIPPTWDFAFQFEDGFARVCQGCRPVPVGEHSQMRGGQWGYIDQEGREVVPVEFTRSELPPPPGPGKTR